MKGTNMCYEKPGPRCSGHTRTNFRAATAKLQEATQDLQEKKTVLRETRTEEARAEVRASVEAHKEALAQVADATDKYKVSRENRAVAMDAWRTAKSEYDASPEGIEKNRLRSHDPKRTPEERSEAREAAMEGSIRRAEQKDAYEKSKGTEIMDHLSDTDYTALMDKEDTDRRDRARVVLTEAQQSHKEKPDKASAAALAKAEKQYEDAQSQWYLTAEGMKELQHMARNESDYYKQHMLRKQVENAPYVRKVQLMIRRGDIAKLDDAGRQKLERELRIKDEEKFIESVRPTNFEARKKWFSSVWAEVEELNDDGVSISRHEVELSKAKSWRARR